MEGGVESLVEEVRSEGVDERDGKGKMLRFVEVGRSS